MLLWSRRLPRRRKQYAARSDISGDRSMKKIAITLALGVLFSLAGVLETAQAQRGRGSRGSHGSRGSFPRRGAVRRVSPIRVSPIRVSPIRVSPKINPKFRTQPIVRRTTRVIQPVRRQVRVRVSPRVVRTPVFRGRCLPFHQPGYRGWARRCYFPQFRCNGYYCPVRRCWFYYNPGFGCYLPVQYINQLPPVVAPAVPNVENEPTPQPPPENVPLPPGAVDPNQAPPGAVDPNEEGVEPDGQ